MRAALVSVLASVIVTTSLVPRAVPPARAQPVSDADRTRAKELYGAAETAMAEGRFADAIRDYSAAYDLTKDPVLFFKMGSANERAGKCDVALIYYGRYAREARPTEQYVKLTRERVAACGGDPDRIVVVPAEPTAGSGSGSAPAPTPDTGSAAGSADAGSAAVEPTPAPATPSSAAPIRARHRAAWLLVGGSLATLTIGAVLAYSANAAEDDVDDLYVGLDGTPPVFDARTRARYDDLIAEGERYQTLSLVAFGLAGALAVGAAVKFATDKDPEPKTVITPTVSPGGAGVSARWRF